MNNTTEEDRKMLSFIAGLMIGGIIGVVTMCLMVAAKEADRHIEECEYEALKDDAPGSSRDAAENDEDSL